MSIGESRKATEAANPDDGPDASAGEVRMVLASLEAEPPIGAGTDTEPEVRVRPTRTEAAEPAGSSEPGGA